MKILRALGLGLLIIVLQFLVPEVFNSFEQSLILFFETLNDGLDVVGDNLNIAAPVETI